MSETPSHRADVLSGYSVSRETVQKLDRFVADLTRWQRIKNLVGPSALPEIWQRHIADSLQLHAFAPDFGAWLDLGSGGGFPGLIVAMLRTERGLGPVHLVESNGRKCAFLRQMAAVLELDVTVHEGRIESVLPDLGTEWRYVSARALAPLADLLAMSNTLLRNGAVGIFPKGLDVELEIKNASRSWDFSADVRQSQTDRSGRIVLVHMTRQKGDHDGSS